MGSHDKEATYERAVKLWISLWNLVLEGKRDLATVCAALQKLVFEKQGWPKHKNWPAICKLGGHDRLLMMALATFDASRDDEQARQVKAAFPECFSAEPTRGPVPWRVLEEEARRYNHKHQLCGSAMVPDRLYSLEAHVSFDIPVLSFAIERTPGYEDFDPIPSDLQHYEGAQSVVEWRGKKFVVLEYSWDERLVHLVPADCVDLDR